MQEWWERAWAESRRDAQFYMEAQYSLPGITGSHPTLDDIFRAALHQRARLKQDQQLANGRLRGVDANSMAKLERWFNPCLVALGANRSAPMIDDNPKPSQ